MYRDKKINVTFLDVLNIILYISIISLPLNKSTWYTFNGGAFFVSHPTDPNFPLWLIVGQRVLMFWNLADVVR